MKSRLVKKGRRIDAFTWDILNRNMAEKETRQQFTSIFVCDLNAINDFAVEILNSLLSFSSQLIFLQRN